MDHKVIWLKFLGLVPCVCLWWVSGQMLRIKPVKLVHLILKWIPSVYWIYCLLVTEITKEAFLYLRSIYPYALLYLNIVLLFINFFHSVNNSTQDIRSRAKSNHRPQILNYFLNILSTTLRPFKLLYHSMTFQIVHHILPSFLLGCFFYADYILSMSCEHFRSFHDFLMRISYTIVLIVGSLLLTQFALDCACEGIFNGVLRKDRLLSDISVQSVSSRIKEINNQYQQQSQISIDMTEEKLMAKFSLKAYKYSNITKEEMEKDIENDLNEWRLIVTASGRSYSRFNHRYWINGYFGVAFLNPRLQRVVIAHRGTVPCFGCGWTDVWGILFTNLVSQVFSACTFAAEVSEVLIELNQDRNNCYELYLTGHSLGGWLANLTAFTVKFLKINDANFGFERSTQNGLHVHSRPIDNPGNRAIFSELKAIFETNDEDVNELDIENYLSSTNLINLTKKHIGKSYRIVPNPNFSFYNSHRLDYILQHLSPQVIIEISRLYFLRDIVLKNLARIFPYLQGFIERIPNRTNDQNSNIHSIFDSIRLNEF